MLLTCLSLFLLALIGAPLAAAVFVWARQRPTRPFPLAGLGAALMLVSFVALPWLSFDPLRYIGLDWLSETVPLARTVLGWLGVDSLDSLLPVWRAAGVFIRPPGWLALALSVDPLTWFVVLWLGSVAFGAAQAVTWLSRPRGPAFVLIGSTVALLLLLLFDLAAIDGLGEHSFPHFLSLVQPFLAVHVNPLGPLLAALALGVMVVGAVQALTQAGTPDDDHDQQEWN